jgi:hypothetical protein
MDNDPKQTAYLLIGLTCLFSVRAKGQPIQT